MNFFIVSALSLLFTSNVSEAAPGNAVLLQDSQVVVSTDSDLNSTFYTIDDSPNTTSPMSVVTHSEAILYMASHGSDHPMLDYLANPHISRDKVVINGETFTCGCSQPMGNTIGCALKFDSDGLGNTIVECVGMCDASGDLTPYSCEMVDEGNNPVPPMDEIGETQTE